MASGPSEQAGAGTSAGRGNPPRAHTAERATSRRDAGEGWPQSFHLQVSPGAWSRPQQWDPFCACMRGYGAHLQSLAVTAWPGHDPDAGLQAHAEAVLAGIPAEAENVVLLGHSFGAFPMLEAAVTLGERVKGLLLIDAFLPELGASIFAQSEGRSGPEAIRAASIDGLAQPPDPAIWGLSGVRAEAARAVVQPHALRAFEEELSPAAIATIDTIRPRGFINASAHDRSPFRRAFEALQGRPDWLSLQIEGSHLFHLERPAALAYWSGQLLRMAAGRSF